MQYYENPCFFNLEDRVCIDLTEDTDDSIVDLTNVETPITLRRGPVLNPRRTPRRGHDGREIRTVDAESDDELPDLPPFECESTSPK